MSNQTSANNDRAPTWAMEGSGHPAVILLCYCHLSLSWNPVTCVQQPKGHLPRCLIDALPTRLKYQALKCPPPSAPICSSLAFPSQVVVPPYPSFSNPKLVIFSVYPASSQQALLTAPSSSIPDSAPIPPGLLPQCPS